MAGQEPVPRPDSRLSDREVTRIRRDQLDVLLDVTRRIVGTLDLERLLSDLLDNLVRIFHVERALLMLVDPSTHDLTVSLARNLKGEKLEEAAAASRSVVEGVRVSGKPVMTADAQGQSALRDLSSVGGRGVRGLVCYPLLHRDQVMGVIYLDSHEGVNYFTPTAQTFLSTLCNLAAIAIDNARRHQAVVAENRTLKDELRKREAVETIVGNSAPMQALARKVESAAPLPVTVLLQGESGTGKELVARAIHARSRRPQGPFVAINCGELPETLVESELFGYKRGAFTGAQSDRKGLFEEADGGTLFLDEITNTSAPLQAKLLRVLQEGEIKRVGENTPRKVDVRLVCATNADLASLVQKGEFREDLFYRINVVSLRIPPLRDRRDDIPLLVEHFLKKYNARFGKSIRGVTPEARELLQSYAWPGNVRELENAVQRAMALGGGETLGVRDLGIRVAPARPALDGATLRDQVQTFERTLVQRTIDACDGNVAKAAESLGMARQQLHRMVQRYGLSSTPQPLGGETEP